MADNTLLKVALFGGAAYLAYEFGWLSFLGLSPTATTASTAPTPTATTSTTAPVTTATTTTAPPIVGANSLDGIYAQLVSAANAPAAGLTADQWNYYLAPLLPSGVVPPDPMSVFPQAVSGFARTQLLSAAQYWSVMAPWLKSNAGLSGLGIYGLGLMWRGW